jgi:hypothetical protein
MTYLLQLHNYIPLENISDHYRVQNLAFIPRSVLLNRKESLSCQTCCDTGPVGCAITIGRRRALPIFEVRKTDSNAALARRSMCNC